MLNINLQITNIKQIAMIKIQNQYMTLRREHFNSLKLLEFS
jgi:hypothetical protein